MQALHKQNPVRRKVCKKIHFFIIFSQLTLLQMEKS